MIFYNSRENLVQRSMTADSSIATVHPAWNKMVLSLSFVEIDTYTKTERKKEREHLQKLTCPFNFIYKIFFEQFSVIITIQQSAAFVY